MKIARYLVPALLFASIMPPVVADAPHTSSSDIKWFSDRSPERGHGGEGGMRMGGMGMNREQDENHYQRLWLVGGKRLKRPACVKSAGGSFIVLDPQSELKKLDTWKRSKCAAIKFPRRELGYYNAYYLENSVQDGELKSLVAKAEIRRFEHDASMAYDPIKLGPKSAPGVPFDVLRLREPDESFFSRPHSGDTLRFQFLLHNQPVQGARVTLLTEGGWRKTFITDDQGIARIQLIRDYFPEWDNFDRRHRERFLVIARYQEKARGQLGGDAYEKASYTLTFPGCFSPNPSDYRSYAFALILGALAFLVGGVVIYLFRRRRVTPFKETEFDEQD